MIIDKQVEVETGKKVTYGELITAAELIGRRLLSHGCQQNDVIVMLSPNSIDLLVAVIAAVRIGAVPALANHQITLGQWLATCQRSFNLAKYNG